MNIKIGNSSIGIMAIALLVLVLILLMNSFRSIDPGHEGVHYKPFSGGIDRDDPFDEGVHIVMPWNDVIEYNIRKRTQDLKLEVLDSKGLTVGISMSVIHRIQTGKSPLIHLEVGQSYPEDIVRPISLAIVRDIVGGYQAEDLYSAKRNELQQKAMVQMSEQLADYHLVIDELLIKDVDLPQQIESAIILKEEQEQRNKLAKKKAEEAYRLALAKVETARGDSASRVINEQAEAESIKIKQLQLAKSPQYIEYLKAQAILETAMKWNGSYGEGNVYGDSPLLLKNLK